MNKYEPPPDESSLPTIILTPDAAQTAGTAGAPPPSGADNYQLGGEIARGGMGSILEAADAKLRRIVAVKVMLFDGDADESVRQRFVREAEVLAQLAHPNIVPIHDIVWEEGRPLFYSMKLVKGRTLQSILSGLRSADAATVREFTLDRLLLLFRKVCDAVAFAHSKGIIHRDLKPENVMAGEFGEVLVMDWGIAKQLRMTDGGSPNERADAGAEDIPANGHASAGDADRSGIEATLSGTLMGTPQYMSPEQATGRIHELDARSDVFSLGGILYSILTLHPPVQGANVEEILRKVAAAQIVAPAEFHAGATYDNPPPHLPDGRVPAALSSVAMKALRLEKTERYEKVAALSADIEAYQAGFATTAERAGLGKQLVLLVRRHQGIFSTVAAAWLLITALAVWFVFNLRAKERRAVAGERSAIAEAGRATRAEAVAVREKESTRQALAKSALALAESARREGNGPEMQAALGAVPDDLRDSTWDYLLDQSDTSIARIRTGAASIEGVAAHPRRPGVFAITDTKAKGKVMLIEVRTGTHLLEFVSEFPTKAPGFHMCVAFSPDGERIALGQSGEKGGIAIHSARDGKKLLAWEAPASRRLEFSADGRLLLQTGNSNQRLNVWDAADGQPRWTYESERKDVSGAFTPASQQVLTNSFTDHLRLVSAHDGTLVRPILAENARALAVRPDGKMAVISVLSVGIIKGVRLADGAVLFEIRAHDSPITQLAFTPDGARFVSVALLADGRQAIQLWDAEKGMPLQTLLGGSGNAWDASVHPLSGELLVTGSSARAWNLTGTPERWTLRYIRPSIAFWGSDDVVFAPTPGSSAAVQKLQAGSPTVFWKPPPTGYRSPSVSADGRVAAIGQAVPGTDNTILFLRNPGPRIEQAATLKLSAPLTSLRLSPTGDRLAAIQADHMLVALYDPATGGHAATLERGDTKKIWDLGWLTGKRLVGIATAKSVRGNPGSEESIVLWDTASGKIVRTATNRTAMDVLAVAPDGSRFAEAGVDKLVRIRDAETLAVLREFRAHDGPITALAWHPSKPILATASADLSVKLWNLDTGRRIEELRGPIAAPYALAFSPSGMRLGCAGSDGCTRIWEPRSLNEQPNPETTGGWDDVLGALTPAAMMQTGNGWRLENGALFSPSKANAILPLPANFSGTSYQVRVKLRQLTAKNCFHLELPVGDQMVGFELDGFPGLGSYSGLLAVDGKSAGNVPGNFHGKVVKDSEQHDLEVTVRLDGANVTLTATLDAQPLTEWTGLAAALSPDLHWIAPPGTLALGTLAADWIVYELKAKRLQE